MRDTVSSLNCRILATSAIALDRAFVQKKLRDELYYRLTAFTIHVPPLRERLGEIHLLLAYFMGRAARQYNLEPRALSDALVEACGEYDWPGNLRELESFVQRFLVIGNEESVISELRQRAGAAATTRENSPAVPSEKCPEEGVNSLKTLVRSVKGDAEKSAILDALEKTRWNRKEAARLLGISYRGILYKIEEYQLTRPTVWHVWKEPSPNDHDGPVSRNSIKL
jgi:DNA-binding NtrC family response regulator